MSFFEPPVRPSKGVFRAVAVSPPAWLGPPHNVLPGIAPLQLIVARTDETVVAIAGIQAYPAGFGFTLCLRLRNVAAREEQQFPYLLDRAPLEGDPLPDELLRFGVQFADGRKATNPDQPSYDPEQEPDRPVLLQHGGGGGGTTWDMEHWTWPLPPPGPFAFVCEWPGRGIAESRAEIDAASILEAAGHAVTLWPDNQPGVQAWATGRKRWRCSPSSTRFRTSRVGSGSSTRTGLARQTWVLERPRRPPTDVKWWWGRG